MCCAVLFSAVLCCAVCMLCRAVPLCEYPVACCAVLMLCCAVGSHAVPVRACCLCAGMYQMLAACSNADIGVLKEMLAKNGKIEIVDALASN